MELRDEVAARYLAVRHAIPPIEWPVYSGDVAAILELKRRRRATILAHNYQDPVIFNGVADVTGDSLAMAEKAGAKDADVLVVCGVTFMAETVKLLNPNRTVLIPDLQAGCSLAASITGADVRELKRKNPGVPVVAYVNTTAEVKAESTICCTSANAVEVVRSLGADRVIFVPDRYLAGHVASQTDVEIIAWQGACEVHERFTADDIRELRSLFAGVVVLSHPECPADVLAQSDYVGSTSGMIRRLREDPPSCAALITECAMSDNVASEMPGVRFVRPCHFCPYMRKITLPSVRRCLETLTHEITIDQAIAGPAKRAIDRMLEVGARAVGMSGEVRAAPGVDVVVVGSGAAGMVAALALAPLRVALLTKTHTLTGGSSPHAQGGVAAAVGRDDDPGQHAKDTLIAAAGLADPAIVDAMVADGPRAIAGLIELGCRFDRDGFGRLALSREGAHSRARVVRAGGDAAGAEIVRALSAAVMESRTIDLRTESFLEDLLFERGRVTGLTATSAAGELVRHGARAVVLATGGIGRLFPETTNPREATGDGLAVAARAGARLADLEFIQFHPTALDVARDPRPLITEALRGAGALLVDARGRPLRINGWEHAELAPRDLVAREIVAHRSRGERVALDARALGAERLEREFPQVIRTCLAAGFDPRRDEIPVAPAVHYHMGGVAADGRGRTSIERLWACGEVACTGAHGANRLASNSLLEALVYGARVAKDIRSTLRCSTVDTAAWPPGDRAVDALATPWRPRMRLESQIRAALGRGLGVIRDAEELRETSSSLDALAGEAPTGEARNMILVGRLLAASALLREESRGAHWRRDFPAPSARYERRFALTADELLGTTAVA